MKQKNIFIESLLALVFAILVLIPQIGYLLGFIAIILSIDILTKTKKGRIKKPTSETKRVKLFAIIAIITTFLIVLLKIIFFVTTTISPLTQIVSDFSQLNYEDALTKCQTQEEKTQGACYVGLIIFHLNDTRVTSGETCQQIKSINDQAYCLLFTAAQTKNIELCHQISDQSVESLDTKNHCLAILAQDVSYCENIADPQKKGQCVSETTQQKVRNFLQPSK